MRDGFHTVVNYLPFKATITKEGDTRPLKIGEKEILLTKFRAVDEEGIEFEFSVYGQRGVMYKNLLHKDRPFMIYQWMYGKGSKEILVHEINLLS